MSGSKDSKVQSNLDTYSRLYESQGSVSYSTTTQCIATDETEIEAGDEIELVRPVLIDDFTEKRRNRDGDKNPQLDQIYEDGIKNTWERGPASYWYNYFDLDNLVLEQKKKLSEREQSKAKAHKV